MSRNKLNNQILNWTKKFYMLRVEFTLTNEPIVRTVVVLFLHLSHVKHPPDVDYSVDYK